MSLIILYPSRFTSRGDGEGVTVSQGDVTVRSLYDIYHARTAVSRSWNYRRSVIESAIRLFGNFDVWLRDQRNNPWIVGHNRKFIEETVDFIHGKPRLLSVHVWQDLIEDTSDIGRSLSINALGIDLSSKGRGESTTQMLQQWMSRPNGIDDLILTLNVLFGARVTG